MAQPQMVDAAERSPGFQAVYAEPGGVFSKLGYRGICRA